MKRFLIDLALGLVLVAPTSAEIPTVASGNPTSQQINPSPRRTSGLQLEWTASGVLDCWSFAEEWEGMRSASDAANQLMSGSGPGVGGVARPDSTIRYSVQVPPLTKELALKFRVHRVQDPVTKELSVQFGPPRVGEPSTLSVNKTVVSIREGQGRINMNFRPEWISLEEFGIDVPPERQRSQTLANGGTVTGTIGPLSAAGARAYDRAYYEYSFRGTLVGYACLKVEYYARVSFTDAYGEPGAIDAVFEVHPDLIINYLHLPEPEPEPLDDYPVWQIETLELQDKVEAVSSTYWAGIGSLSASCRSEEARALRLKREVLALGKEGFENDEDNSASANQQHLIGLARAARNNLREFKKTQDEMIAQSLAGWQKLEGRVAERLNSDAGHKEEIDELLKEVRRKAKLWSLEFRMLAYQDEGDRRRLLAEVEGKADAAEDPDIRMACIRGLSSLGGPEQAFARLVRFQTEFPREPQALALRQQLDLFFLRRIYNKIRAENEEVDRLVREWGRGQIDPETGAWKLPDGWSVPWFRWMGGITGRTYDLWSQAKSAQASTVEQTLGLHLIMMLRAQDPGLTLQHIWYMDEGDILERLPEGGYFPEGDPRRQEHGIMLETAVFRTFIFNPDVEMLTQGKTPPVDTRASYINMGQFQDEFADWDDITTTLMLQEVIFPAALGRVGGLIFRTLPFQRAVQLVGETWGGAKFLAPATMIARYDEALAMLPGSKGLAARMGDHFVRPYVMAAVATKAGQAAEYMGADEYGSLAVTLFTMAYQGAGSVRLGQIRTQQAQLRVWKALAGRSQAKSERLLKAGIQNKQDHDELESLLRQAQQAGPTGANRIRQQAEMKAAEIDSRIKAYNDGLPTHETSATMDEMVNLRETFRVLSRPPKSAASNAFDNHLAAAKKHRERATGELGAAQEQAACTKQFLSPATPAEQAARAASIERQRQALARENAKSRALWGNRQTALSRGMLLEHHQSMRGFSQGEQLIIIVRNSNPRALNFQTSAKYRPKPVTLKLKTAKQGPNEGLVVCRQEDFASAREYQRAKVEVASKGLEIDSDGVVRDKMGRAFYSDYDLHGVYRADGNKLPNGLNSNSAAFQAKINQRLTNRWDPHRRVQHGAHDDWANLNKKPEPPATAYLPDGSFRNLETVAEMKAFYTERNIPWPYPNH